MHGPSYARPVPRLARSRALLFAALLAAPACQDPPSSQVRVPPPAPRDEQAAQQLRQDAHKEALELALESARTALIAVDPLAAYQTGLAPAGSPPLETAERSKVRRIVEPARTALSEIEEAQLPPHEVVILRVLRFALSRAHDELQRRSPTREDPVAGLALLRAQLDELDYRLLHDDCDAACVAAVDALAADASALRRRLVASSSAGLERAMNDCTALAARVRALAQIEIVVAQDELPAKLETLALALDEHRTWLDSVGEALPRAQVREWTAKPLQFDAAGPDEIQRLPDIHGQVALIRRFSVEERIDLSPERAFAQTLRYVGRWEAMQQAMLGDAAAPEDLPALLDQARCEAALERVRAALEGVEDLDAPRFDCARYLSLRRPAEPGGGAVLTEAELILDILDAGVIEPQRRELRSKELPELALVSGQWSLEVHRHLRRVMVLARLDEPAATLAALSAGRSALCLAAATLWVHAELGPPEQLAKVLGPRCAMLGDIEAVRAQVLADPRASLGGFGLSLIGDEPARMVGFDRFFWAPLGLMKTLATPQGMHPDNFSLPDDPAPPPEPELEVQVEELNPK